MLPCLQPCLHRTLGLYPLEPVSPNRIPKDGARAFPANTTVSVPATRAAQRAESQSCLLPPQANPASPGPCSVKADANTTASTDPIDKQGGCATGLGHRAFDQLVAIDQVFAINDRMTDLNHGKRVFVISGLINRNRGVGRIAAEVVRTFARSPFVQIGRHREMPGDAHRAIREIQRLLADIDQPQSVAISI